MKQYDRKVLRHDLCAWGYFTKIKNRLYRVCGLNKNEYEYPMCDICPKYVHWQSFVKEKGN